MPYGYNGRILHINLTDGSWDVEEPSEAWYRTYVGGSSFASYFLLKELEPGVDPLSEGNVLVFACTVLTGAPLSGFNRYTVAAKSPLTGAFGESEAGGYFGPELKFAGYDAIVIRGRASKPVYLWVHNGEVEIRDAGSIWGQDNWVTLQRICEELGDKRVRVASIGPAGERLVPFSCVQNDLEHFNGRTGMGAVMGSKNLKAVAVRGKRKMSSADPEKVKEIGRWHNARIKTHRPNVTLTTSGTSFLVKALNDTGMLPTHNFREGVFDGADRIGWDAYEETIFHSAGTCYACSVKCKRRVALEDDKYPLDPRFGGPEYETLAALGSMVDNDNLPALATANQICNLMGMDTISAGCAVAFAMECFEEGILTKADTGGRSLHFGDADAMIWLIEEMAHRRGIGKILSKGVKRAAEEIGKGSEKYSFHIKGQEMPLHDGRGKTGMAMGFALSPTGADHIEIPHDTAFAENIGNLLPLGILEPVKPLKTDSDKVRFFSLGQKAWGINNCYGICNFCSVPIHAMTFARLVEAVQAITGWDTSLFEIMRVSERSNVMARVFNTREGFGPKDDRVIRRWHEEMPTGPLKGQRIDPKEFQDAIDLYYELSGWDKEGKPTRGKLVDLDLEWLIE
ncbi:aldehyde:ferredoxin oxidoreductase [candidate division WOR-1 bacterium DG_54_3]|uniref:Aldehyde:ferredoxin oxidoreductase n=1 Tax=candidate division WOR-1 bacterium DG_54_3 TaxID=1703775 RepID=A0A0S7Y421_UNCSA|nr:MAG: aldehyde:ferredoxin oxidoreductase [candidate division WOR-1 bacterium DG_54_3]